MKLPCPISEVKEAHYFHCSWFIVHYALSIADLLIAHWHTNLMVNPLFECIVLINHRLLGE